MKLNIKTLFAASLATLAVSCTDLDVPVDSQYTKYPGTEEAIVSKMAGIYFQMRECVGRRYMEAQALSSDEFTALSYSGNWLDTAAMTTRGAKEDMMHLIAELIEEVLNSPEDEKVIARVREKVNETMKDYPLFAY